MSDFLDYINEYSDLLKKGAKWETDDDPLAPVLSETDAWADDYIYEFYCYICLVIDLMNNYDLEFIKGVGKSEYKFPRKAALKKGKPRFHALENGELKFQICAGTKINCSIALEEDNNPDISFQKPDASENPNEDDIILIMDAKFKEDPKAVLPKSEVYKFITISYNLFNLKGAPSVPINFDRFADMLGNCLITNGQSYTPQADISLLKLHNIKEVENFAPKLKHNVLG